MLDIELSGSFYLVNNPSWMLGMLSFLKIKPFKGIMPISQMKHEGIKWKA